VKKSGILLLIISVTMFTVPLESCKKNPEGFSGKITPENIKAGFIYSGKTNDNGFTQAFEQARYVLEEKGIPTMVIENIPETTECDRAMNILIENGCNVIYATRYGFEDSVFKYAKKYPDIKFSWFAGTHTAENVSTFFARIYQARYLSGMAAGAKTHTGKIGYIASVPIPEVIQGLNAFTLGARKINPEAKIEIIWTDTWYDPYLSKTAARILIEKGCDVITWHQNSADAQDVAASNGIYSIGYNSSSRDLSPDYYITAATFNWAAYILDDVERILNGTWTARSYWGSIADGAVDIDEISNIDKDIYMDILEARTKLKDGTLNVFTGPVYGQDFNLAIKENDTLSDSEILNMKWYTRGIIGLLK